MVSKEQLKKSHKLKIMLRGNPGTGKSFTGVKISDYVANIGFKVLYLDYERGAVAELLKLDDRVLENIIYENFNNYRTLVNTINKYRNEEKDKLKLIIIDPLPLVEITRLSARDAFLDQGYYYIGEKKVDIDNKETFDLRGYMYQLSGTWTIKFLDDIVNYEQDIICTLMTPNKYETNYDGKFDIVFETFVAWVGNNIYYKSIPKKMRGIDLNNMPAIDNPHKKLLEAFAKKYDGLKREDNIIDENKEEDKNENGSDNNKIESKK